MITAYGVVGDGMMDGLTCDEWYKAWRIENKMPTVIYLYEDKYKALADFIIDRYGLEPAEYKMPQIKELPGRCVLTLPLLD